MAQKIFVGSITTRQYLFNEKATKELYNHGWLQSGDEAFILNGHLFVTGRIKEEINIRGVKYFCHDIEEAVMSVDGVCIGYVAASTVLNDDEGTNETIIFFCPKTWENVADIINGIQATIITKFSINPKMILPLRTEDFPKTTSGKIQRLKARENLLKGVYKEAEEIYKSTYDKSSVLPEMFYEKAWIKCNITTPYSSNSNVIVVITSAYSQRAQKIIKLFEKLGFLCITCELKSSLIK